MITFALNKAKKIISVSNALKLRTLELGIPEAKIDVIPNGVDKDRFKPADKIQARQKLGLPIDKKIILFVGNLVQVKGIDYLLDAIYITRDHYSYDNIVLCLIGDGILRKDLEDKTKKLKINESIRFEGIRPHNEIPTWMNACDLLCLPSLNEGCPNVILEALACGKPVVASNVGGIPEILSDDRAGIMVNPGDPAKLAEAIIKALQKNWDTQALSDLRDGWKEVANKTMAELKALM